MMRRCISGALKATVTALGETLTRNRPIALKVQAVLGECWNLRLERARRRRYRGDR
jgi:hypothetical protein